jgi:hypothetical protein
MALTIGKTARGFARADFTDRYGEPCSIQMSSLATEAALWLGTEGRMVQGPPWTEYTPPDNVSVKSRMHLTQDMVKDLLPLLQHFAEYGELP